MLRTKILTNYTLSKTDHAAEPLEKLQRIKNGTKMTPRSHYLKNIDLIYSLIPLSKVFIFLISVRGYLTFEYHSWKKFFFLKIFFQKKFFFLIFRKKNFFYEKNVICIFS